MNRSGWFQGNRGVVSLRQAAVMVLFITAGMGVAQAQTNAVAWGSGAGAITPPTTLWDAKAVSARSNHTLALKSDGTVVAWGSDNAGETNVPAGLAGVKAVAAGTYHSLALRNDGTVLAWGMNLYGQLNVPAGLTGVTAISAGQFHSLALKSNGTVVGWGDNSLGQTNVPAGLTGVKAISTGHSYNLALKDDGTVVGWGSGAAALVPPGLTGVKAIAAGNDHALALRDNGTVVAWGDNSNGQTNTPAGLTGVIAISAGSQHCVALKDDGSVVAWPQGFSVPTGLNGVIAISAGSGHTVALKAATSVIAWGRIIGQNSIPASASNVKKIVSGVLHSLALKSDGTVMALGFNDHGQTDVPAGLTGVVDIAGGVSHSLALKSDGTVIAWGSNFYGETNVPAGLAGVVAIASADFYGIALKSDGTIVQWGMNSFGQAEEAARKRGVVAIAGSSLRTMILRSDGTMEGWGLTYSSLIPSMDLLDQTGLVAGIAAGGFHSLLLESDGTVVALGQAGTEVEPQYNFGQTNVPAGLTGVVDIATGNFHSLALKGNGTVVAWGWNDDGQSNVPAGLTGVVAISGAETYSLALRMMPPSSGAPVTISSSPAGRSFSVIGTGCEPGSYTAPQTLSWTPGASCTVSFPSTQSGGVGTEHVFTGWADGDTAALRTIAAPTTATTYTANFKTQYQLTTLASPTGSGMVTGADYYDAGSAAPVVATANAGYQFLNWTGLVASASSASTTVTMSTPVTVTANFRLVTTTTVAAVSGNNGAVVNLSATVNAAGAFSGSLQFQVQGTNVGSAVLVNGPGTYTIPYTIVQPAGTYTISAILTPASPEVSGSSGSNSLTVIAKAQTITFNTISSQVAGASVNLSTYASASSGLPVGFTSLTTGICTVSGTTASMIGAGACAIQATQAGNGTYAPATPVSRNITVSPAAVPNFTIKANPPTQTAFRDVLAAFLLELKSTNGFNGTVALSCSGGPAGAKCANLPQTVRVNGTAYAISGMIFPKSTKPGTYTVTFTGVSGTLTNAATASFTVK